ncbi:DUF551 domain-containing protein [Duncaniella freteri]|uniref:DUF551 domain-containing protein n=1 Tax=Duncaniella freteri TaxID=2530391 RepID=UPI0025706422|nr:DUF551 domain-containing protein [Duncaniella freteri]
MTPTKEQKAQEYAEKKNDGRLSAYPESMRPDLHPEYDINDIAQAYSDGHTACEQSMWRSVEEELPEVNKKVIVRVPADEFYSEYIAVAYWDGEDWIETQRNKVIRPSHFMYVPSLPDTNTEKK